MVWPSRVALNAVLRKHPFRRLGHFLLDRLVSDRQHRYGIDVVALVQVLAGLERHRLHRHVTRLHDLGLSDDDALAGESGYKVVKLFVPEKSIECEFVEGDSLEEKVGVLAEKINSIVASVN